jgi:hypothetical protein
LISFSFASDRKLEDGNENFRSRHLSDQEKTKREILISNYLEERSSCKADVTLKKDEEEVHFKSINL